MEHINPFDKLACTMTLTHCKYSPQLYIRQLTALSSYFFGPLRSILGKVVTGIKKSQQTVSHSLSKLHLYPLGIDAG